MTSLSSTTLVPGLLLLALLLPAGARAEATSAPKTIDARHAAVEAPPPRVPDAGSRYRSLIEKEAAQAGLAPEVAEAVMAVESGYNPDAIGGVGEIGLMQILPSTARMLGFIGSLADLAVPETNIHYGVMYLAKAWRLAGGDLCTAAMKYRAGHGETRFSFLSVNYCIAVRSKLAARGFRVTGSVPGPTFGDPALPGRGCGRKCLGISRTGSVNIAALNTQLSALVAQARQGDRSRAHEAGCSG
ncbi:transglycosylase [Bradyrhizobium genosp. SA-3]|uniref:transglycosylase SLT domain-containing protein n=1 Tax=Bradyrhizobium genosp. SA-3 TaxID=508868 RepID=UPI0010292D42|nr:transglycosylase [Bradyrhizobium genosp. SA-3]